MIIFEIPSVGSWVTPKEGTSSPGLHNSCASLRTFLSHASRLRSWRSDPCSKMEFLIQRAAFSQGLDTDEAGKRALPIEEAVTKRGWLTHLMKSVIEAWLCQLWTYCRYCVCGLLSRLTSNETKFIFIECAWLGLARSKNHATAA
jgi:hypothetical protein